MISPSGSRVTEPAGHGCGEYDPADVQALLNLLDDVEDLEFPLDYDHREALARVDRLRQRLEQDFHCTCQVTTGIEDASFTADLRVPPDATKTQRWLWTRISNHGPLAIYGLDNVRSEYTDAEVDAIIDPDDRERMEQALTETGFIVLPKDPLHRRYDGANEHWRTWQHPYHLVQTVLQLILTPSLSQ